MRVLKLHSAPLANFEFRVSCVPALKIARAPRSPLAKRSSSGSSKYVVVFVVGSIQNIYMLPIHVNIHNDACMHGNNNNINNVLAKWVLHITFVLQSRYGYLRRYEINMHMVFRNIFYEQHPLLMSYY